MLSRTQLKAVWGHLRCWLASDVYSFGMRRDLAVPILQPPSKIPITVRPLQPDDIPVFFPDNKKGIGRWEAQTNRKRLMDAGIQQGYVAATGTDAPCYIQWLILPRENEKVQRSLAGLLPWLGQDEVLLEQAFTLEPFRGLGIMSSAMARIAELGRKQGARWALTFADQDNIAALKGCRRAGFRPYLIRRESWRLFQRRVSFHLLPRGTPFPFDHSKGTGPVDRLSMAG